MDINVVQSPEVISHIAASQTMKVQSLIKSKDDFLLIFNIQIPQMNKYIIAYNVMKFDQFLDSGNRFLANFLMGGLWVFFFVFLRGV